MYIHLLAGAGNPMDILRGDPAGTPAVIGGLGLPALHYIMQVAGGFAAIIIVFCSLIVLLVVNYPKTVSQTKTKVVHACIVTALLASLPFLADVLYSIIKHTFYY